MAKKTLGYEELQWICPNCAGINPGPQKTCSNCGAPQPEAVQFEKAARTELLQDEQIAAQVKAGADIHCPYCSARNRADAPTCSQCGGDLASGRRRESGQVLGAFQTGPARQLVCPQCGAENPDTARSCTQCGGSLRLEPAPETPALVPATQQIPRRFPLGLVIFLVLLCVAAVVLIVLSLRTESLTGTVSGAAWERALGIEALAAVEYQDWQDRIPQQAELLGCDSQVRSIQAEPLADAQEVCGTPYSVDTGSGYAEVVQDCEYHVYDLYCTYTVQEWTQVDRVTLQGTDFYPEWPEPTLATGQRLGQAYETYTIWFETQEGEYTYSLQDVADFQRFQPGSSWTLNVNSFGGVVSVEP